MRPRARARPSASRPGPVARILPLPFVLSLLLLAALPGAGAAAEVYGWVSTPEGQLLSGAVVRAADLPSVADTTGASGGYRLALPSAGTWRIECRAAGLAPRTATVEVQDVTHRNFQLLPQVVEGFETGDLSAHPWQVAGGAAWAVVGEGPAAGTWCARSGNVGNLGTSTLQITLQAAYDGEISFLLRVSSEEDYDGLAFLLDGVELGFWSGEVAWREQAFPVAAGPHLLTWTWRKDEAVTLGQDRAWLDEVRFPGLGTLATPALSLAFDSLDLRAQQGFPATVVERIGNSGKAPLEFRVDFAPPDIGGGPDEAGYTWTDSDRPGGPVYEWIDLVGSGHALGPAGDEAVWGPIPLGFSFPYHGALHDRVWVCANGFITFGDTLGHYRNTGLPDPAPPNGLIAPFWDDLDPTAGGQVLVRRDLDAQRFVVQWHEVPHFRWSGIGPPETFQAILHADGRIRFQYAVVSEPEGCSVGLEDLDGLVGLQVARDQPYLRAGLAVLIRPGPPLRWASAVPSTGLVAPGGFQFVAFTCDAESLALGLHLGTAILHTNDPLGPSRLLPIRLEVVADLTGVGASPPPAIRLLPPRPNPANPRVLLSFRLPAATRVALRLYDAAGRLVRTLADGELAAGEHTRVWDGRDREGRPAASGSYLARLSWSGGQEVRRVVLVR